MNKHAAQGRRLAKKSHAVQSPIDSVGTNNNSNQPVTNSPAHYLITRIIQLTAVGTSRRLTSEIGSISC